MTTKIGKLLRTGTVLGVLALGLAACGPAAFPEAAPSGPVSNSPVQISSPPVPSLGGTGGMPGSEAGPMPFAGSQGGTDCPTTGVGQAQTSGPDARGSTQWDSGAGQGQVGGADGQGTAQSGTVGAPVTPGAPAGGSTTLPTPEELEKRLGGVNLGPSIPVGAGVGTPEPPAGGTETTGSPGSEPEPVPAEEEEESDPEPEPADQGQAGGVAVAPGLGSGAAPTVCK
jgi:hypothetical protein